MTKVNIAIAPDDNYTVHCATVMASVLASASVDSEIHFFILDGGLSEKNKKRLGEIEAEKTYAIDFLKIDESDFDGFPGHGYISITTWYRIKLGSLLPTDVERVLYLDCDTIVKAPLDELFEMPMDGCVIGTSLDCTWQRFNKLVGLPLDYPYFNAGVLLIDVGAWKAENVEKQIFEFLAEDPERLKLYDQNVLNILLGQKKKNLGIRWNFQYTIPYIEETCYDIAPYPEEYLQALKKPAIIHYVGAHKPWKKGPGEFHIFKNEYVKHLKMTPWREYADKIPQGRVKSASFAKNVLRAVWRKPRLFFKKSYWARIRLERMTRNMMPQ